MSIRHWLILGTLSVMESLFAIALSASAETKQIVYTLNVEGNQTFETLVQKAESLTGNLVEQTFAYSPSVTEVSITIVGERNGQEVPLLSSRVSRTNWQKNLKFKLDPLFQQLCCIAGLLEALGTSVSYNPDSYSQ